MGRQASQGGSAVYAGNWRLQLVESHLITVFEKEISMRVFNAHDVVQFAIRVEENGEVFYREAASVTNDQGAKETFNRLATEEAGHKKTFQGMLGSLGDYRPTETYEGEYLAYLQDYIDGRVIFKNAGSGMSQIHDTLSALDLAIQREMDSIVYYQEIKAFVPDKHHKTVDGIVGEERKHFSLLSEIRKGCL
jgi:rubrerythrin